MIKDLVLYLLRCVQPHSGYSAYASLKYRQGCYSQDGDIVVLCMYLGQLVKLRDALSREVVVVIDERDARDIATHEDVDEDEVEQSNAAAREVQVSKQVSVYR